MTDYEQLAEEIRAKRKYHEAEDGTIFCSISRCPGSQGLRCYRTQVPICQKCAVKTPVGYISREAARDQQNQFFDAEVSDYLLAGVTAFVVNLPLCFLVTRIGFLGFFGLIIVFFLASTAGGVISEAVWRVLRKRRGRYTGRVAAVGIVLSSIPLLLVSNWLVLLIYAGIVITTVNARFEMGIRL